MNSDEIFRTNWGFQNEAIYNKYNLMLTEIGEFTDFFFCFIQR